MRLRILKSKLHLAAVTETRLNYHGSITIDEDLMDAVGLVPFELVLIANQQTGDRAETYVIKGKRGGGQIEMNGAIARMAQAGDRVIILAFADLEPHELAAHVAKVAILDDKNRIVEKIEGTM
jgi:aspartate 1-decarboxylase